MANSKPGSGRGFASMDPARQREIASQGGRAAHASGNAHEFTSEEARAAGALSHGRRSQSRQAQQQATQGNQQAGHSMAQRQPQQPGANSPKPTGQQR